MTDVETTKIVEIKPTKKAPVRKADPMVRIVADVKTAIKELGEFHAKPAPVHRKRHHEGRSLAWLAQYDHEDSYDALLLSRAFDAAANSERSALVQLAAVALAQVEKLDAGK